jgi:phosphatidylserine synthase
MWCVVTAATIALLQQRILHSTGWLAVMATVVVQMKLISRSKRGSTESLTLVLRGKTAS